MTLETTTGCLWKLENTWVCDQGVVSHAPPVNSTTDYVVDVYPTVDFVQVADPTLYNEAGRVLCETSPVMITIAIFTALILLVVTLIWDKING